MRLSKTLAVVCLSLGLLIPITTAETEFDGSVRLTFRLIEQIQDGEIYERSYEMLLTNGVKRSLDFGHRVPVPGVPTEMPNADATPAIQVSSFTYQHVGFGAKAQAILEPGDRVRVVAEVDATSLASAVQPGAHPVLSTLDHKLTVVLRDGVPTQVASSNNGALGSVRLELTAEILD